MVAIMVRRVLLVFLFGTAVFLVPWTGYLARTLPDRFDTGEWRVVWVGFDIALTGCFAAAAWLGARRRRGAVPMLTVTATLLCCDAWFDVVMDWSGSDRWTSLAMAALLELPIAAVMLWRARSILVGGPPARLLTMRDIEIHTDPSAQSLLRSLGNGPAHADTLAGANVTATLERLAQAGHVRRLRDRRWALAKQNLRMPNLADVAEKDRPAVAAYLDAKYDRELRLLGWAARHRDEFGPWGRGERATTHLTAAQLASFDAEYRDLVTRYCLLHDGQADGTREVAIRFYAFPMPEERHSAELSHQPSVKSPSRTANGMW